MAEREQKRKVAPQREGGESVEEEPAVTETGDKLKAEMDDLLDEILDGDHSRDTAVLVGHQGGLQPAGSDLFHQRIAVERRRHHRHLLGQRVQAGSDPIGVRDLKHLFDMHHPDGLVEVAVNDGEP